MATVPRLEIGFRRASEVGGSGEHWAVVLTTTPVEIPPWLLGPAVLGCWFGLAPLIAWQAAGLLAAPLRPRIAAPIPVRPPGPAPATDSVHDNVIPFPDRRGA